MTFNFRELKSGLIRRLDLLSYLPTGLQKLEKFERDDYVQSVTFKYLSGLPSVHRADEDTDPNSLILYLALEIAHVESVASAKRYLDHFQSIKAIDTTMMLYLLEGTVSLKSDFFKNLSKLDKSLFAIEESCFDQESIRSCYSNALKKHGIELPFDRKQMIKLLRKVRPTSKFKKIEDLESIKDFMFTFVTNAWPLFSPKILTIIFEYFKFTGHIGLQTLIDHQYSLRKFGFEKLHARLVLLRAVNGDAPAIEFQDRYLNWEDCGFASAERKFIAKFLNDEPSGLNDIASLRSGNPIEQAIMLSIYVNESQNEHEFLDRLLEVYDKDEGIVAVLNWNTLYVEVKKLRRVNRAALVFLASILYRKEILANYPKISGQYGIGGAGADLRKYANFIRDQKGSHKTFLKSFDVLPKSARSSILRFLVTPGMLDRIAAIFRTPSSSSSSSNIALDVLNTKRDCIRYGVRRTSLTKEQGQSMLSEIRLKYRQLKYEKAQKHGRIKIGRKDLAIEIYDWLLSDTLITQSGVKGLVLNFDSLALQANASVTAPKLCTFICFSNSAQFNPNRFAFDIHLGDKLRHNFISNRFKAKTTPIFEKDGTSISIRNDFSALLETHISDFSRLWLTIHEDRSFVSGLERYIEEKFVQWAKSGSQDLYELAEHISAHSLNLFQKLLRDCKEAWLNDYFPRVQEDIKQFGEDYSDINQLMVDKLCKATEVAFNDSAKWMCVNKSTYPRRVALRDLFETETYQLIPNDNFKRHFSIEVYKRSDLDSVHFTLQDLLVPGKYVEPLVAIVDNLISNACENSGHASKTPITIRIVEEINGITLKFVNEVSRERLELLPDKIALAQKKLVKRVDHNDLRKTKGTGLHRMRFSCTNAFGRRFSVKISNEGSRVTVECFLPLKELTWTRANDRRRK